MTGVVKHDGESEWGIVLVDRDGVIRFWSDATEGLTGHRRADAVGSTLDLIVPPQFREQHWAGFRTAMASGRTRGTNDTPVLPVLCAGGGVRLLHSRFHLIFASDGSVTGVVAVLGPVAAL